MSLILVVTYLKFDLFWFLFYEISSDLHDLRGRIDIEATLRLMVALTQKVYFFRNCDLSNVSC